jgi:hypothetical protein
MDTSFFIGSGARVMPTQIQWIFHRVRLTGKTCAMHLPSIRTFFLLAGLISVPALADIEPDYYLLAVKQVGIPVIKNKDVIFKTNLHFRSVPENFWIFYDQQNSRLVMDIYGGHIGMTSKIECSSDLFKKVDFSNNETSLSLSGRQSRIYLSAEPGWHFEAIAINKSNVQITAWKTLSVPRPEAKAGKNRRLLLYMLTSMAASTVTFLLIYLISQHDN